MKELSTAMAAHVRGHVTTLATCWKITRRDGTVMGFTDHDTDITFESVTYIAASGFTPSAVASSAALNVDDLDVEGMLSAGAITETDLLAGVYDYAEIDVFQVNYADLTMGTIHLRTGWLGEVQMHGERGRPGRFCSAQGQHGGGDLPDFCPIAAGGDDAASARRLGDLGFSAGTRAGLAGDG